MQNDRSYWISVLEKIAEPVLINLHNRELKKNMPVRGKIDRSSCSHLEALGRLLTGMAPWLETEIDDKNEEAKRQNFTALARDAIDAATDTNSPDFMNFCEGAQPLVDAAFLAHAIIRAPKELWIKLDNTIQKNLINALMRSRKIKPAFNNWLLFSAMIETALCVMGQDYDVVRIDYALKQHEQWYKGDGIYGDGQEFHWDYYNSFVIQPMLVDILRIVGDSQPDWKEMKEKTILRAKRYAQILERMISPEGTFPPIGRSLAYRFGSFQLLAQMALEHSLPENIKPSQVRCALTAVIKKMIEAPGTFDKNGWLNIGFYGNQPDIGEVYISTGSLYLCASVFLPLGLPSTDEFWSGADEEWTSKKIWSGQNFKADHAL